jgi:hypothetical protein
MFSKLRGAMNVRCGVVVFMDAFSMGWMSALKRPRGFHAMLKVMAKLSRLQRLRAIDAVHAYRRSCQ